MTTEQSPFPLRTIRSYAKREGRMSDAQANGLSQYYPLWGLTLDNMPWDLSSIFTQTAPCVFEIGFGMGSSLFTMAEQNPQQNFIGVEVHRPGVGALLAKAGEAGLTNLRVCIGDAKEVLAQAIPDNTLARVQIFFPDPWPKKRHHKRRLVQAEFIQLVRQKLQLGGAIHLATDWQPYAAHMLTVMNAAEGYKNTAENGACIERPAYRPLTKYESRGQRLGHDVFDIIFVKTA